MKRSIVRVSLLVLTLACAGGVLMAQGDILIGLSRPAAALSSINWLGPFALTPNDTVRFNYWNGGSDAVLIRWQLSNGETGEQVCGDLRQVTKVGPGQGAHWDYSQTLDANGKETRHCGGEDIPSDEIYFDSTRRHQLVGWIIMQHASARAQKLAVDLPTIELFDSMLVPAVQTGEFDPPAPIRSATFGRTFAVIHANPTAPSDFLLQQLNLR